MIGLGHWYSAYGLARALAEYPRGKLIGVTDTHPGHLRAFSRTFGVHAYLTIADLLARDDLDLVHICPPVAEIPAATIAAADAGKHVILGKPMAMNLEQADAMVAAVRRAQVTCVPFQGMFRLADAPMRKRIDAGEIGEIAVMHATGRWSIAEDWLRSGKPGWFADPAQVPPGGGRSSTRGSTTSTACAGSPDRK
ncbi:MAG: hypothetical protein FJ033_12640 [Chloroflexi bacterium]|nr:hypothetical protein [Chloroflexota bacterium]